MTTVLQARGIHCSYTQQNRNWGFKGRARQRAVEGVNLTLERGEIFGLAGESGSGKSTLARAIAGLLTPDRGSFTLDGKSLPTDPAKRTSAHRQQIQMIFQDPSQSLSPRRTIAQILAEPAEHFGLDASSQALKKSLDDVGLGPEALGRYPHQFSSGQRQRISIARALICQPQLLIADEALSALDVSIQAQILQLLKSLQQRTDTSILLISHDLAVLSETADRVGVMYAGRLLETATNNQFFSRPAHPYSRQLLSMARQPAQGSLTSPDITSGNQVSSLNLPTAGVADAHEGPGCVYAGNCVDAMAKCTLATPPVSAVSSPATHHVECYLYPSEPD